MSQGRKTINSHIETYLNYYCNLSHAPEFAVLLQGQWGAGKTWFINKYRERLKEKGHKCLYVSLNGMTSLSEIGDAFFQQLHPILSSKGMVIVGKFVKGLLKFALKIDLNNDNRDDGTLSIQTPEINLPDYLKNIDKSILIFDDLERCKIDLGNILGYINFFVEHQKLKVILVANEDELQKNDGYKVIKEKLIGKTFGITLDFEGALENFIAIVNNSDVRYFLSGNTALIQDLYEKAKYENLRNLKQIILDFERIFDDLPEEVKKKPEVLQELLKLLMAFSIEIKRGSILPKDIGKLKDEYLTGLIKGNTHRSPSSTINLEDNDKGQTGLKKVINEYNLLVDLFDPFPNYLWWEVFLDKGIMDTKELEQSILNSRYFQDENTPSWIKLWHWGEVSDNDFDLLINKVELEYNARQYTEIGVVKHVFGLFLTFSDAGLYNKSKEEILNDFKLYIDCLKGNNQLTLTASSRFADSSYRSLGFQGLKFDEFREFSSYIEEVQELAREESMPAASQDLLVIMQKDSQKFCRMICLDSYQDNEILVQKYHEIPILRYIEPSAFVEKLFSLSFENRKHVFSALNQRYVFEDINGKLIQELEWLKSFQELLQLEVVKRKGKVSGFSLDLLIKSYLSEAITNLQLKKSKI